MAFHEPLLVNTVGHCVAVLVFGLFLLLLLRGRAQRLTVLAAALALVWNATSLVVLYAQARGVPHPEIPVTVATAALSLLPAVLLHLSVGRMLPRMATAGYVLGFVAVAIHASEGLMRDPSRHRTAIVVTAIGFGLLTALSGVLLLRGRDMGRRGRTTGIIGAMALFLFAMSFVHFDAGAAHRAWSLEMLVHHAGVPLALVVLVRDYRFLLLDVFFRVLTSLALAGLMMGVALRLAGHPAELARTSGGSFQQGLLVVGACLLMAAYAFVNGHAQRALTRVLFGRQDVEQVVDQLRQLCSTAGDEAAFRAAAGKAIAGCMGASLVELPEQQQQALQGETAGPCVVSSLPRYREELERLGVEVLVPLRLAPSESHLLALGRRRGGRPYLSEDLRVLARLAAQSGDHVEHFRTAEMRRLVAQAELRALESQVHPHFLFNALNTLYGVIPKQAAAARTTVLNLADILRYFLQAERTYIPLEEEIRIVKAYLEIEHLRLGERLRTTLDVDPPALRVDIPILSVQTLVENAVKHGIAAKADGGEVRIGARMSGGGLLIRVEDNGAGFAGSGARLESRGPGVGLQNVERRLKLCYGPEAGLRIDSSPQGTVVEFQVPLRQPVEVAG